MPLMLIEVEADSKVWFMYYLRLESGGTFEVRVVRVSHRRLAPGRVRASDRGCHCPLRKGESRGRVSGAIERLCWRRGR